MREGRGTPDDTPSADAFVRLTPAVQMVYFPFRRLRLTVDYERGALALAAEG